MPQYCKDKLKNSDERKSKWVVFPNGKSYLLPLVAKGQKIIPTFGEEVDIKVETEDAELTPLLEAFLNIVATVDNSTIIIDSMKSYGCFLNLVRHLIQRNYDYSNEEVATLLTMDKRQLDYLFNEIMRHALL